VKQIRTKYLQRYLKKDIQEALETLNAVVVLGPKFCERTTISKLFIMCPRQRVHINLLNCFYNSLVLAFRFLRNGISK